MIKIQSCKTICHLDESTIYLSGIVGSQLRSKGCDVEHFSDICKLSKDSQGISVLSSDNENGKIHHGLSTALEMSLTTQFERYKKRSVNVHI